MKDWFLAKAAVPLDLFTKKGTRTMKKITNLTSGLALAVLVLFGAEAAMVQTVNLAIASKSFQHLIYPIALDRGYMKEEGIDLKSIKWAGEH